MFHKPFVSFATFILIILAFTVQPLQAQQNTLPRFELAPCPVTYPRQYNVECGYLIVPEEHGNPEGATVKVAIAIFKTQTSNPLPDPLIYLSGGPGSRTLDVFAPRLTYYLSDALRWRDVILVDQRGIGYSEPSLACPENDALLLRDRIGPSSADISLKLEAIQQCYERLISQGVNIAAFNTVESAGDIAAIGPALGYPQVNINGGSYGSTLAMTVMRHYPEGIRSVILQGITPPEVDLMASFGPDFEHALNLVFDTCAADENCAATYPNLKDMFYEIVTRLQTEMLSISFQNPLTGQGTTYLADADDFIAGMQGALYSSGTITQIPALIDAIYKGNTEILRPLVLSSLSMNATSTPGALYAMRCMDDVMTTTPQIWAETVSAINPALQSAFLSGDNSLNFWQQICAVGWGARQLDPVENTPLTSAIPTLMMNGLFDPVTPTKWAVAAVQHMPNSLVYEFPDSGHGVDPTTCAVQVFRDFLNTPTVEPDTSCIQYLHPIQFAIP